jgi:hypothetical protein
MRTLLAIPVLLLTLALPAAAAPPEEEPKETPEQKAISRLLDAIHARDARAAQQVYDQVARDFKGKDVADEATCHLASFHFEEQRFDKAQELLLSLKRSGRENRWTSYATLKLSEVARQRGDERSMISYLEEATKLPAVPTERNLMDTRDTRQEAILRLAWHYRDKGDFTKALDYFTRWEPHSGCATCRASVRGERQREILSCQLHLQYYAAAVRDRFRWLREGDLLEESDARLLTHFYRQAGQLSDLRRLLDDCQKAPEDYEQAGPLTPEQEEWRLSGDKCRNESIQLMRDILHVETLEEKKDVAALVAICQEEGDSYRLRTRRQAAAEALAGLDAVAAVKSALDKRPKEVSALMDALGLSNDPAALEALKAVAKQERDRPENEKRIESLVNALAKKGKAGRAILRELAEGGPSLLATTVRDQLEWIEGRESLTFYDRIEKEMGAIRAEVTRARPKAGSLPRILDDLR